MKKFLTGVFAVVMAMTLITGCNKKGEADDYTYIQDNGKLKIGITLFEPMNYNGDDGELTGFETEFATAVCEKLGLEPEFIVIDWDSKEMELSAKTIDCVWNGMTITEERKANMDLSVAYMNNKQVMVTKAENADKFKDNQGLEGVTVVAEAGSAGENTIKEEEYFSKATYVPIESQATALLEVESGTADCAVIDFVMSIGSIGEGTDFADICVVDGATFAPEEYAIAFRKNSPSTVEKINKAIADLGADGTLNEIAKKYKLEDLLLVK